MKNYSIKAGIRLPLTKYIPGYGLCTITAATTDAQAEAIIATGHGHMFEPVNSTDSTLASNNAPEVVSSSVEGGVPLENPASESNPAATNQPVTNTPKPQKRNGKATTK